MRHCIFAMGTRAQLIKMAPVIRLASELRLEHSVWLSGQHSASIEDLIKDFDLHAAIAQPIRLKERSTVGTLLVWLPGALRGCYRYVREVTGRTGRSPLLVVHGDTLSTLVSAVAGRLGGADIVHLESGLTSGAMLDPFPEELLRRMTFRLTKFAICPSEAAERQMAKYSCRDSVNTIENTLLDCVRYALSDEAVPAEYGGYFVVSIHRVSNIFSRARLAAISQEVVQLSELGRVHFVLHPPTERRLAAAGLLETLHNAPRVCLQPRTTYSRFIRLLAGSRAVLSDGGSNQEELSYLGVPTILYRSRSERPDGIGSNIVFRNAIPGELIDFVASGRLDRLRAPARHLNDVEPSRIAVLALRGWSLIPAEAGE